MRSVVVAMVMLALVGCGRHNVEEQYAYVDVSLSALNLGPSTVLEQTWNLTLRIQNPNNYDIPADGMKFDVEVNGKPFARGVDNQTVMIPRLGEATVQVKAISDLPKLVRQFGDLRRFSAGGIDYYLYGRVYSGEWNYPFEYAGSISPNL
jgi:LEA14-like dessication related protein